MRRRTKRRLSALVEDLAAASQARDEWKRLANDQHTELNRRAADIARLLDERRAPLPLLRASATCETGQVMFMADVAGADAFGAWCADVLLPLLRVPNGNGGRRRYYLELRDTGYAVDDGCMVQAH